MQSGQQNATDQTSNFFWLIVVIAGAFIIFWFVDSEFFIKPIFWVRNVEIEVLRWFASVSASTLHFLHLPALSVKHLDALQNYLKTEDPAQVDWKQFAAVNTAIGQWTRFPIIIIIVTLAAVAYFYGANLFRHSYNMKSLRVAGQEVWPQITPVISLDLVKENIDKGEWAMAKLPLTFCRDNDLLQTKIVNGKKIWVLKQKPAFRLFALQVGSMWNGIDALPIHLKALVLIFLARATGQRALAVNMLSQIATSAATGKLDFTGVSEKLQSFKDHKILRWVEKRHAYISSAMATLLEIARSDGVLASAEFLWLKPVDRRMWFLLNTVGRATSVVEVAGAYAHWKAEKKVERPLKTPMVKTAVDALDESLQNILFVDEGEQWRTRNVD